MSNKFRIFTDFDGTISINDIGDEMFVKFADTDWDQIVDDWKQGKITSRDVFSHGCEHAIVSEKQLNHFCDQQAIDTTFRNFVDYCAHRNYPLTVLSDGLDHYIDRILKSTGFDQLSVLANKLVFINENKIKAEFPYYGLGCSDCANCKGYHIRKLRENGEIVVFIGDGYSDRCAVKESDIIFAKDDLASYCLENGIAFHSFKNFSEVLEKFKKIEQDVLAREMS